MRNMIAIAVSILGAAGWLWFAGLPAAAAEAAMWVTPGEGPVGTQLTISGQGFQAGEAVYLEIFPVGASEPYRIGDVSADSAGGFEVNVVLGVVYPAFDAPDPALPGQGQQVNLVPGDYHIMAYPESFGNRTAETIAKAPKVIFRVTASSLPTTGGGPRAGNNELPLSVVAGLLLMAGGLYAWRTASAGRCQQGGRWRIRGG